MWTSTAAITPIYKRLLLFQRVAENLQEAKKEIEEAFRAREKARAKRLLRSEDGKPEEAPLLLSHGNPKSLRFRTEASTSMTVILQILTVSLCLMLQGLSCTFVVRYHHLEIIRIISCWTPSRSGKFSSHFRLTYIWFAFFMYVWVADETRAVIGRVLQQSIGAERFWILEPKLWLAKGRERNAVQFSAAVCREERCVTTLKTVA